MYPPPPPPGVTAQLMARGIPGAADSCPAPMSQHVGAHASRRHQTCNTKFLHQRQDFLRNIN
jgi:hypothetical protein